MKHGWAATPSHIKTQGTASGTTHSFLTIHGYSVGLSESQISLVYPRIKFLENQKVTRFCLDNSHRVQGTCIEGRPNRTKGYNSDRRIYDDVELHCL